jgi:site-specific DNA-cytosine methylase
LDGGAPLHCGNDEQNHEEASVQPLTLSAPVASSAVGVEQDTDSGLVNHPPRVLEVGQSLIHPLHRVLWSFLLKLDPNKPAPTIQAQPGPYVGPFHWDNRRLRVGEVKRLFGFPDDFDLVGSRGSVQAQLGNCVPPPLAQQVVATLAPSPA